VTLPAASKHTICFGNRSAVPVGAFGSWPLAPAFRDPEHRMFLARAFLRGTDQVAHVLPCHSPFDLFEGPILMAPGQNETNAE
jgi:hypothetical protein